jgi:alpha-L-fucosidase
MTLNKHWGYNKADDNWKQPKEVIRNLVDIASKGGNYLLNIGPTAEGLFPDESTKILGAVGVWMKANGESIYATTASPLKTTPSWGRVTKKEKTLYLHVFDWPADGKLSLPDLPAPIKSARRLADNKETMLNLEGSTITLPGEAPDPLDSVIALEMK